MFKLLLIAAAAALLVNPNAASLLQLEDVARYRDIFGCYGVALLLYPWVRHQFYGE